MSNQKYFINELTPVKRIKLYKHIKLQIFRVDNSPNCLINQWFKLNSRTLKSRWRAFCGDKNAITQTKSNKNSYLKVSVSVKSRNTYLFQRIIFQKTHMKFLNSIFETN